MHAQVLPLGILPEMEGAVPTKLANGTRRYGAPLTDGFFEWENPRQEPFGTDRLAEVLRRFSDRDPEIIIAELYEAVVSFSEGRRSRMI